MMTTFCESIQVMPNRLRLEPVGLYHIGKGVMRMNRLVSYIEYLTDEQIEVIYEWLPELLESIAQQGQSDLPGQCTQDQ